MKTKLLSIIFCAAALTACQNVDDTFEFTDDITVSSLQTVDTMEVLPLDTVRFKFLVSTNRGAIRNLQLDVDESVVERVPEKTNFGLIDATDTLSVDADGNLSRDVSTVVVEYPVVIKQNPNVLKNAFKATLRAINAAGKSATNYTHFKGTNLRKQTKALNLQTGWYAYPTTKMFVDPTSYKSYSCIDLMVKKDDEQSKKDSIEKVKGIEFAVGYRYDFANPNLETYRLFSPDCKELKDFIFDEIKAPYIANTEEMHHTVFYRLEAVGGSNLDEQINNETDVMKKYQLWNERNTLNQNFFDNEVNDDFVASLDFSNATDFLYLKGGIYAFKTEDGRKGVFIITYYSVFGHYAQIPVNISRLAIQAMGTE